MLQIDFAEQLKALGERIAKLKDNVQTEEATKQAMILPFLNLLGYDTFNPLEVVPEFVADVGLKKGEKVDYAIMKDGKPIFIIECKHHKSPLNLENASQLFRYFTVTTTRFAILTNGIVYKLYSDLAEPNKMDEKPFFEFDITNVEHQIEEIKKFHKSNYDVEKIIDNASALKFIKELKEYFAAQVEKPNEEFARFFIKNVHQGTVTAKVLERFTPLVQSSLKSYVSELIQNKLRSALAYEADNQKQGSADTLKSEEQIKEESTKIETTLEEMEGYLLVKSILRSKIEASRIHFRDSSTSFTILLDDSNRKPICRLYLSGTKKQIGIFDEAKKESKSEIKGLDDIFTHADRLIATALSYGEKS